MAKKRGQVEIQFNWILILVAGALIFLFFFSIINWARKNSNESSSATVSKYLDSIFTASSVVKSTVNTLEFPFKTIEFTCDDYRVDKSSNLRNIRNKIIFAPERIEKGNLVTWSMEWDVPFRVTNFLFVSSPYLRYIFITDDENNQIYQFLNNSFPEELNAEFYNPQNFPSEPFDNLNNFKVRLVYIGNSINYNNIDIKNFKNMARKDVTALVINGLSLENAVGISFYYKSAEGSASFFPYPTQTYSSSTSFYSKAALLGAIFSENPDDYGCNMGKAFQRLKSVSLIYKSRSDALSSYYLGDSCEFIHDSAFDYLATIYSAADAQNYANLAANSNNLQDKNKEAQRNSCALIY